ncbi:unnamed protein product [Cochlearia groenlandica]
MHQNAGAAPNAGGCFLLMIHKKGGRIRTYGRPDPDLLGWVACFALVTSVRNRCAALPSAQEQYRKHRMPWFLLQTRLQVRVIESAQLGMLPMPIPELLKEAVAVQPLN